MRRWMPLSFVLLAWGAGSCDDADVVDCRDDPSGASCCTPGTTEMCGADETCVISLEGMAHGRCEPLGASCGRVGPCGAGEQCVSPLADLAYCGRICNDVGQTVCGPGAGDVGTCRPVDDNGVETSAIVRGHAYGVCPPPTPRD